jgi:predicted DNA binding CopG/RHH family protein
MKPEDIELTAEEQEIEESIDLWVPASAETRTRLHAIAERSRKTEAISLRMTSFDLSRIKEIAAEQGLPYQTLINTLLHKYVTNQMLERREVIKTLQAVRQSDAT